MSKRTVQKVLYVTSSFPVYTHTFTAYEMATIQQSGVDVHVVSLWASDIANAHTVEKQFLDRLTFLKLSDPELWFRAFQQILLKPQLLILIFQLFLGQLGSIYAMAKLCLSLPKGLYLGYWVRKNQFDQIHAHFLTTPTLVALLASRVSGVPYSVTIHAHDIFATNIHDRNTSVPLKCENANLNVVISNFNLNFIHNKWPGIKGRFEVIYNGIDFALFQSAGDHIPSQDGVRILSNGRLVYSKGHSYLIEAIAKLRKKNRNVSLQIIGKGPFEPELRELIGELGVGDYVQFLGVMPQEEIVNYYQQCDLFVLACAIAPDGDMDGLPTVLIESLAMRVPTISTQVSGVPEIIQDHVTGLCIPPHDSDGLADAIEYMLDHPDEAQQMAHAGHDLVIERFDRLKNARKLLQLWQDIEV